MAADPSEADLRPWAALGRAVVARRVAKGFRTRNEFAKATGLTIKTLGEIERGERTSYDPSTLARVEQVLQWPPGYIHEVATMILAADSVQLPSVEPSWLSTPEGIARHIHRDDLPLVALLHRAGLTESDLFRLILHVRAVREKQNADLLADLAQRIRELGGHAPEVPYPPTWLADETAGPDR